ncbi:hypothetical protein Ancab_030049 [Ancistrocladus abbreviatus]
MSQIPNVSKDMKVERIGPQISHEGHDNLFLNVSQKPIDLNSEKMLVHLSMSKSSDAETISQCSSIDHHERTYSSYSGEEGSSGAVRKHVSLSYGLRSASPLIGLPEISHLEWDHWFTLRDLEIATNSFSTTNIIGRGGYGVVYRGRLINGPEVAVKRLLNNLGQAEKEFRVAVEAIGHARHKNLVRLLGYCIEGVHRCIDPDPGKRPRMTQVVRMLESDEFPNREDHRNRKSRTASVDFDSATETSGLADAEHRSGKTELSHI